MQQLRKIERLSYSQISCFQWCKKQWELRYLDKIRLPEKPQALAFGIAVHRGIETFLRDYYSKGLQKPVALNNGLSAFNFSYILSDDRGADVDTWQPVGQQMINTLVEKLLNMRFAPMEIEVMSKVQCAYPNDREFSFVGKIDCLANLAGSPVVVDWKTASKPYSERKVERDNQLTAYAWLLSRTFPPKDTYNVGFMVMTKPPDSKVYWYPSTRDQRQIQEFEQLAYRTHEEMETRPVFPGKHRENVCKWCEYASLHCRADGDF